MTARFDRRQVLALLGAASLAACAPSVGTSARTSPPPAWTSANLGLNYAWLNDHRGNQHVNWLAAGFDGGAVDADLDVIASLGVTIVRAFCPLESVMSFDGQRFAIDAPSIANLHHFLSSAAARGLAVIPVLADGNVSAPNGSLDGKFRWPLITAEDGLLAYRTALREYVRALAPHDILAWETFNEPYATLVGNPVPAALGVGIPATHRYLRLAYETIKDLVGATPVLFSDLHEEQQRKYRLFSDPLRRARQVDDCTDVYALHVFRSNVAELADLSPLTSRPKWCVELGNTNYVDPTGADHGGRPGQLELVQEDANARAVQELGAAMLADGFSLVLPWAMADNPGMFTHNLDGTHTVKRLPRWMASVLQRSSSS